MKFIEFPMADLTLGAPEGKEDQVQAIKAHRGAGYITICMELDEEERKAIAERGTIWLSFWDINPTGPALFMPVRPDVFTPALVPFQELGIAGKAEGRAFVLQYLSLNLICLQVDEAERDFSFRSSTIHIDNVPQPFYDLVSKRHPADLEPCSNSYYFKECLEILGRFQELAEYPWLKIIFPNCPPDVLVMRRKEQKPTAPIIAIVGK